MKQMKKTLSCLDDQKKMILGKLTLEIPAAMSCPCFSFVSPVHRSVAICTGISVQKPIAAVRQRRAIVSACDFAFSCMDCVYFTEWC